MGEVFRLTMYTYVYIVDSGRGAVQRLRHLHRHASVHSAGDGRIQLGEHQIHQQCQWQDEESTVSVHAHVLDQSAMVRHTFH